MGVTVIILVIENTILILLILLMVFLSLLIYVLTQFLLFIIAALHMAAANGHVDIVAYLIRSEVVSKPFRRSFLSFFDL